MNETPLTINDLSILRENPTFGRIGMDQLPLEITKQYREAFSNLSYPRQHPAIPIIAQTEKAIADMCAILALPTGHVMNEVGNWVNFGNYPGYETPECIQIPGAESSEDPMAQLRIRVRHQPNFHNVEGVSVEQGTLFNPKRDSGYFFSHIQTMNSDQFFAQFSHHWGAEVDRQMNDQQNIRYLLKGNGHVNSIMTRDVRTKLPDVTQGVLRAGFLNELSYKMFMFTGQTFGIENPVDSIMEIYNGSGDMNGYYLKFKEAQEYTRKVLGLSDIHAQQEQAAALITPQLTDWGFTQRRVFEIPKYKLIICAAHKP
ncbi:MAG TPA: hypothetical protein VMR81_00390 [Patescibacteria group bacterium]|jgi:hypothetical protein|nr:hypothetical protein [Patescibacteria group bacterium]